MMKSFANSRITPAYAGKRAGLVGSSETQKDHPRMCGEKHVFHGERDKQPGSPPRMRGKGVSLITAHSVPRITPAYAGKRQARRGAGLWSQDHPRVCGEKM